MRWTVTRGDPQQNAAHLGCRLRLQSPLVMNFSSCSLLFLRRRHDDFWRSATVGEVINQGPPLNTRRRRVQRPAARGATTMSRLVGGPRNVPRNIILANFKQPRARK